jgi:hypothetical protein
LPSEASGFVEYLACRRAAQTLSAAQRITDDDIAAEIAAYRSGQ